MSARPIDVKRRRRYAREFHQELPRFVNLVDWLVLRRIARSKREARKMILARRVQADSHTLGIETVPVRDAVGKVTHEDIVAPLVPAALVAHAVVVSGA